MTINDLILNVKSKVEPSVTATPQQITEWIKEQFYLAISIIQEYNPKKFNRAIEITVLNEVQEYKLPVDFLTAKKVEITYFDERENKVKATQLDSIEFEEIENISGDNQKARGNRYYLRDGNIGVYPKPKFNSLHKIRIYYYYQPVFSEENLSKLSIAIQYCLARGAVAEYLSRDMEYNAAINQLQISEKRLRKLCQVFSKDDRGGSKNIINEQTRYGYHRSNIFKGLDETR